MNYNNSPQLFANSREYYRNKKIVLVVVDGHIIAGKEGVVARFDNDEQAKDCLRQAGYVAGAFPDHFTPAIVDIQPEGTR